MLLWRRRCRSGTRRRASSGGPVCRHLSAGPPWRVRDTCRDPCSACLVLPRGTHSDSAATARARASTAPPLCSCSSRCPHPHGTSRAAHAAPAATGRRSRPPRSAARRESAVRLGARAGRSDDSFSA
eukprot:5970735-Prymnesium_polylepis.2